MWFVQSHTHCLGSRGRLKSSPLYETLESLGSTVALPSQPGVTRKRTAFCNSVLLHLLLARDLKPNYAFPLFASAGSRLHTLLLASRKCSSRSVVASAASRALYTVHAAVSQTFQSAANVQTATHVAEFPLCLHWSWRLFDWEHSSLGASWRQIWTRAQGG